MNIVHVSATFPPVPHRFGGAVQRRVLETATCQARRGHRVTVYSPGPADRAVPCQGVCMHYIPCRWQGPARHVEFQSRAVADLKRAAPGVDAVYFHGQPEGAWLSSMLEGKKYLWYDEYHFRRSDKLGLIPFYRSLLRRFDRLLAVSEYCRSESARFWRLDKQQIAVVYNGVNQAQFSPNPKSRLPAMGQVDSARPIVLYVGRVCHQKGSDILLDAYAHLKCRGNDMQLVIAGPIGQFGRQADGTSWTSRFGALGVTYLGPIEESRLSAVYNAATVFVMPTRTLEMFGMAVVEAQSCGLPVVASDHGGLIETVPLSCGNRFAVGDAHDLADKALAILQDAAHYPQLVQNCLANAARFAWDTICTRLEKVHAELW